MAILDAREAPAATALLFDGFELRLDSGELLRRGEPVKLQLQPARVLAVLALRAGVTVTREEIRKAVWGMGSHLDFDLALNYSIRQIRVALDDSAVQPRFVETVPRVGYRFLGPVEVVGQADPEPASISAPEPPATTDVPNKARPVWRPILVAALALACIASLIALRRQTPRDGAAGEPPDVPAAAMHDYLEGQFFESQADLERAQSAFQRAAKAAPRYAPAWAALGHVLLADEAPSPGLKPLVETAERRALELDPNSALAHLDRAMRLFQYEYDWPGAERELRRALELDPQHAYTHFQYAMLLAAQARFPEALEQAGHAQYLQPAQQLVARYAWFYYLARRYDEAIAKARHQIELATTKTSETNPTQPDTFWAFRTLTLALQEKGDPAALDAARGEAHWLGDPEPASLHDFWATKERHFAQIGPNKPWFAVVPAIKLGETERALDLLEKICRDRSDPMIAFLRVDPLYDGLRSQPRFQELLRCARLVDAAPEAVAQIPQTAK